MNDHPTFAPEFPEPPRHPATFDDLAAYAHPQCVCRGLGFVEVQVSNEPRGSARNDLCGCGSKLKAKRCACARGTTTRKKRCVCTDLGLARAGVRIVKRGRETFIEFDPGAKLSPRHVEILPAVSAAGAAE